MKDSQLQGCTLEVAIKYIKADNERFSTLHRRDHLAN